MSLFDQIAGALLNRTGDGTSSVPGLLTALLGQQEGGLQGLIQKFQAAGQGNVVNSWVGTGPNQPVSGDLLHSVLGSEFVQQMSAKTGLPMDQLLGQMAQHLPQIVDQLTPNGEVPQGNSLLQAGLSLLNKFRQA